MRKWPTELGSVYFFISRTPESQLKSDKPLKSEVHMSHYFKRPVVSAICCIILVSALTAYLHYRYPLSSQRTVKLEPRAIGIIAGDRLAPTQVFFNKHLQTEVISDFINNRFIYRKLSGQNGKGDWQESNIDNLKRPHGITYDPTSRRYYTVDTDNNRILSFDSVNADEKSDVQIFTDINGVPLGKRPHDIGYNPADKYIYVVLNSGILRFNTTAEGISDSDFVSRNEILINIRKNLPAANFSIGYIRSLTIFEGRLYLSNSSQGNIIQMDDFLNPETWTVHINKNQPNKYAEKGSFDKDGLILNDIEHYQGYWYASNYYHPGKVHNYLSDASVAKNKLIRWKTWQDFENSTWDDLSSLLHGESIPYYFSKYDNNLYLSMFHIGNEEGIGSGVYKIETSYF